MDTRHPSHRYLSLPDWAFDKAAPPDFTGLDLRKTSLHAFESHSFTAHIQKLPINQPLPVGLHDLRKNLAAAYAVEADLTYVAPGIGNAFRLICQHVLGPGDHVAVCEPVPDWVKRCILATGAFYVDVGRDWSMNPQHGALKRLLEDGDIRLCFVQTVCSQTGTLGLSESNTPTQPLWVFDHTWQPSPQVTSPGLHLVDVSLQHSVPGLPLCLVSGEQSLIEGLWRLDPKPWLAAQTVGLAEVVRRFPENFKERSDAWLNNRNALRNAIQHLPGIRITGDAGPAAMIGHPLKAGFELFKALHNHNVYVDTSASHTFHEHVALRLPDPDELSLFVDALESVWS